MADHQNIAEESDHPFQMGSLWAKAYQIVQDDEEHSELLEKFEKYLHKAEDGAAEDRHNGPQGEKRLAEIQILAKGKLEKLPETRTSFTIAGKRIVVREQVQKAVQTIKQFKAIITGALSAEPHAALAWACVLGVLPILENLFQKDEDAADGLNKILFMLVRYQHLEESVLSCDSEDLSHAENTRELFSKIETSLIDIYVKVYIYQIRFVLQYGGGKWRRNLGGLFKPEDWKQKWNEIDSTRQLIDQAVQDRVGARTLEIWATVKDIEMRTEKTLKAVDDIDARTKEIKRDQQSASERELLLLLPIAANATFDSAEVLGVESPCLKGTQRHVLSNISDWAEDPSGELIFWLHSMAGTGKSSIALTVADALKQRRPLTEGINPPKTAFLGASFFFKQVDKSRNHTQNFFTTIARGLGEVFEDFKPLIAQAINDNLTIGTKAPQQQLEHLITKPLSILDEQAFLPIRFIIVIDALDECADEREAEELVGMLAGQLQSLNRVQLRLLITSRREKHIARSFEELSRDSYHSALLNKVKPWNEGDITKDDITVYLSDTLAKIARRYRISEDVISESTIDDLTKKVDGLFIYAATACRFLDVEAFEDPEDRQDRIDLILQNSSETDGLEADDWDNDAPQNQIDEIYNKVLLFPEREKTSVKSRKRTYAIMEMALGFLVVVFEPVAIHSLREFLRSSMKQLNEPDERLDGLLKQLQAIITVPLNKESPLELIHLSFRDFILSKTRSKKLKFKVDESQMHKKAFLYCLSIMSSELHQDICGLVWPGTIDSEIPRELVEKNIQHHLRYVCRYWVDHLAKLDDENRREVGLLDGGDVHKFLQKSFLYWLEAMGLVKETAVAILIINKLQLLVKSSEHQELSLLIYDMKRFTLSNRWIIDHAPLQIYASALTFSPKQSKVRSLFESLIPRDWIVQEPVVNQQWTAELSVLQGHTGQVNLVAFSPVQNLVISLARDSTRIWDTVTGTEKFRFDDPKSHSCAAFSPDGKFIALGARDKSICVREFAKGNAFRLVGHGENVCHLAFSPKTGNLLASLSYDDTIRLWNVNERRVNHVLRFPRHKSIFACEFTPDEQFLIVAVSSEGISMWNVTDGQRVRTFDDIKTEHFGRLAISADGLMASFCESERAVTVFNLETGVKQVEYSRSNISTLISMMPPDGKVLLVETLDACIEFLDATTPSGGKRIQFPDPFSAVALSQKGDLLVSAGLDYNIRLWDLKSNEIQDQTPRRRSGHLDRLVFSPDSSLVYSRNYHYFEIRVYESVGNCLVLPTGTESICFSPDNRLAAFWINGTASLWDKGMTTRVMDHKQWKDITFSPNGSYVAMVSTEGCAEILDSMTFKQMIIWEKLNINHLQFSPDGQTVNLSYADPETGECVFDFWRVDSKERLWQRILEYTGPDNAFLDVEFSPNCAFAAFRSLSLGTRDSSVWIMIELATGKEQLVCGCDDLVFCPKSNLIALEHAPSIKIKETFSLHTKHDFKLRGFDSSHPGHVEGMAFSKNGLFVAASRDMNRQTSITVQLWDTTSGIEIGRYLVEGEISSLAFLGESILVCDQGQLPLPSCSRKEDEKDSKNEEETCQDLLYVGNHWVYYGLERILWLPPAYRSNVSILRGSTLALAHETDDVRIMKFNPAGLPVRKRVKRGKSSV